MLNVTTIKRKNSQKVESYYSAGEDDYYAKDGSAMQWQGSGAEALGLSGAVEQSRFRELLDGRIDANTKIKRVGPDSVYKERLAYDLTFSAPKGVSLQALVHGDKSIIEAHDKAVAAAIEEAERIAQARITRNGKTAIENTGKLVVAKFRHETSRALDPALHTHAVVLNMTQRSDGQWRSLMNDSLYDSLMHVGTVYKAELSKELEKAGFVLRYDRDGSFDLAHFTEHQLSEFSNRKKQIVELAAAKGLDISQLSYAEKRQLVMESRDKKKNGIDREALRHEWQQRAKDLGIDFTSREWSGAGRDSSQKRPQQLDKPLEFHADSVINFAIKSLTERQAIVTEKELMDTALRHGYGRISAADVRAGLARRTEQGHLIKEEPLYASATAEKGKSAKDNPYLSKQEWIAEVMKTGKTRSEAQRIVENGIDRGRLVPGDTRYATHIAQKREREILAMERLGRGTIEPRIGPDTAKTFLADRNLKAEQENAVLAIASARNRFIGVQGFAGVGKSYMTVAAKDLLESQGYRVTSLAPYGSQVKALQSEGLEARTLQSFLKARDKKIDEKTIVFIDEAGVIPARQMHETMQIIEQAGARAVFLGDTAQTKAVEAGKPFDQLQKAGMETAHLTDIQRQKNLELLKAVKLAADGLAKESLAYVSDIRVHKAAEDRYTQIVKAYADLSPEDRKQTLIVTGTNASRLEINNGIRQALDLEGKGIQYGLLNRLDTTQAERRYSKYYKVGAVIVPEQDYKLGLKRGEMYTVLDTGPGNRLTVRSRSGETLQFSPAQATKLSVYDVERTELAIGDQVRITRNDAALDLANGDRFTVKAISADKITLEGNGRTVELDAKKELFVSLGYASTVHSAQGLTSDRVLINVETKSRTTAQDVYYVAVSRARHEAVIFTDNGKRLGKAVSRLSDKTAALELKQLQQHAKERNAPELQRQPKPKTRDRDFSFGRF